MTYIFSNDDDLDQLLRFGRLYASLGDAVTAQIDALLDHEWSPQHLNPNAVDLIDRRLGRQHPDIHEAAVAYRKEKREKR